MERRGVPAQGPKLVGQSCNIVVVCYLSLSFEFALGKEQPGDFPKVNLGPKFARENKLDWETMGE